MKEKFHIPKESHPFLTGDDSKRSPVDGRPMRRVFMTDTIRTSLPAHPVVVHAQYWECQTTKALFQDEWQVYCIFEAAKRAIAQDREVVFYHTKARKANESEGRLSRLLENHAARAVKT